MFENRIELEDNEDRQKRYEKHIDALQKTYEFFWELREAFGTRLFGGLAEAAYKQLSNASFENIGRRRSFRVKGPIKIPLTSVLSD